MNADEYLEQRLEDQIRWYDRKSVSAQRLFKRLRGAEIFCAAAIPVLAGFADTSVFIRVLVASLGALIVVLAGYLSLQQASEKWVEYRATAESLKHEKFLYLTGTEPYTGDDAFHLLVERVEGLISQEHSAWTEYVREGARESKPGTETG